MASKRLQDITIEGLPVSFPFTPYPVQVEYMANVIRCLSLEENGLLESPTGTGKTLCLLCASLAWLRDHKRVTGSALAMFNQGGAAAAGGGGAGFAPERKRILYASRTHAQLTQVIAEFKKTAYVEDMTMAVLASRDRLCVHREVSKISSSSVQTSMCQAVRSECRFYKGMLVRKGQLAKGIMMPTSAGGIGTDEDGGGSRATAGDIQDIEDLAKSGRKQGYCPYYLQRELSNFVDITFLPYSYIFDNNVRKQLGLELEKFIIIVDEAHNVPAYLSQSLCHDFTSLEMARCINEVSQAMATIKEGRGSDLHPGESGDRAPVLGTEEESDLDQQEANFAALKLVLLNIEKDVHGEPLNGQPHLVKDGQHMMEFFARHGIVQGGPAFQFQEMLSAAIKTLAKIEVPTTGLVKFSSFLNLVMDETRSEQLTRTAFRFVVIDNDKKKELGNNNSNSGVGGSDVPGQRPARLDPNGPQGNRTLGFWCLDTSIALGPILAGVSTTIMTSGTLSPMEHFALEVGIKFHHILRGEHVIGPDQVASFISCTGPGDVVLNSSWQNRNLSEYKVALGMLIVNLSRAVRQGGVLVFFPSYAMLNQCVEFWKTHMLNAEGRCVWGILTDMKPVFLEPKSSHELTEVVKMFQEVAQTNTAILMAVCRGKVSEGIDFKDAHGRAVIVTGIPFANQMDLLVSLKKQYLTSVADKRPRIAGGALFTGDEWYQQEALRAVNQCVGRVIRHKDDFGAIVLADERFQYFTKSISPWVKKHTVLSRQFGETYRGMHQFFAPRFAPIAPASAAAATTGGPGGGDRVVGGVLVPAAPPAEQPSTPTDTEREEAERSSIMAERARLYAAQQKIKADEAKSSEVLASSVGFGAGLVSAPTAASTTGFQKPKSLFSSKSSATTTSSASTGIYGTVVTVPKPGAATGGGTGTPTFAVAGAKPPATPNTTAKVAPPSTPATVLKSDKVSASAQFCEKLKGALPPANYATFKGCLTEILKVNLVNGSTQSDIDAAKRTLQEQVNKLRTSFTTPTATDAQSDQWLQELGAFLPSSYRSYYLKLLKRKRDRDGEQQG